MNERTTWSLGRARASRLVQAATAPSPEGELALALGSGRCLRLRQVHGADVAIAEPAGPSRDSGDAIVSAEAGLAVAVVTADCVPLLLASADGRLVAAVHAGWRGAAAGVVQAAVAALEARGVEAAELEGSIGPAAGGCCYEVGDEVVAALRHGSLARDEAWLLPGRRGRPHVELRRHVASQLGALGVKPAAIAIDLECTICGPRRFPSYRREGRAAGRIWSAVVPAP